MKKISGQQYNLDPEKTALLNRLLEASEYADSRALRKWLSELRHYTVKEKDLILGVLSELRDKGYSLSMDELWEMDFERKPVSIRQFIEDEYYLGGPDGFGTALFPLWKEELDYICDPTSRIVEWVITGSIGCGKTYVATVAQLYKGAYYCSCLKNPQKYFGLASNTDIVFGVFNATMSNAEDIDFKLAQTMVDKCSYFAESCPRKPLESTIEFPSKKMEIRMGSRELHALGANLFSFMMDEANFMQGGGEVGSQAWELYNHARRRMQNRFERFGVSPGLVNLVSSKKSSSSFLERHLDSVKGDPTVHVSDYAVWDVKGRGLYSKETFRVMLGDSRQSARILDEVDQTSGTVKRAEEEPLGRRVIEVPVNFYTQFHRDLLGSLRDIAGVETDAVTPLITRVETIYECIDRDRVHPFVSESVRLPLRDDAANLLHMVDWKELTTVQDSRRVLKVRPTEPRYMHVDLALTGDCAGIALGHAYGYYVTTEYDPETGQSNDVYRPRVYVDFMVQVRPTEGDQIDITKIVSFILNLRNYGVYLKRVTFDGYQSAMARQILDKSKAVPPPNQHYATDRDGRIRLDCNLLSVDRTDGPYTLLRDTIAYGALSYYEYQPLLEELPYLEHNVEKGKVDHPSQGSKDVADALCGMVYNVITHSQTTPSSPESMVTKADAVSSSLDEELLNDVMGGYYDQEKVVGIEPPPQPQRHLGGRSKMLQDLNKLRRS